MCFDETQVLENCINIESSMGELCVGCNKCGRFDKQTPETSEI